jgi:hypothetical protein
LNYKKDEITIDNIYSSTSPNEAVEKYIIRKLSYTKLNGTFEWTTDYLIILEDVELIE